MADAPDPGDAKDSAKDDTAPGRYTAGPRQRYGVALIELRRLTIFRGPALDDPPLLH